MNVEEAWDRINSMIDMWDGPTKGKLLGYLKRGELPAARNLLKNFTAGKRDRDKFEWWEATAVICNAVNKLLMR
jgi:hypothetical protein